MKVELQIDESWAMLSVLVGKLIADASLNDEDRANLRRWRSEEMRRSGDSIRALTQRLNEDLQRVQQSRERSQIQKHDWV
ncbi:MAG: hypothetical protein ACR2PL_09855 [Dehalococcoidia bacterium]